MQTTQYEEVKFKSIPAKEMAAVVDQWLIFNNNNSGELVLPPLSSIRDLYKVFIKFCHS